MKPICVPCQRFYRPDRNGVCFIEGMPEGNAKPGLVEPEKWHPYKLWSGDRWKCPDCGATIISGVGSQPIREHYQTGFQDLVEQCGADLQINDC